MLNMFSRAPGAEKAKESKRMDQKLGREPSHRDTPSNAHLRPVIATEPDLSGPAMLKAKSAPINPDRPAIGQTPAQRAKVFANAPSIGQYLFHLSSDIKAATRSETQGAVLHCSPVEVQRIGRLLAKHRGRYLAQLVDLGAINRGPIGEAEIVNLRRAREMAEEIERGFDALRNAIENGDLTLDGVKAD
jgi:hypothetical protein